MWAAILPAAASFLGGMMQNDSNEDINSAQMAFNREEAEKSRTFNAAEAQKSRDYQRDMSNTQYQRSVSDMTAAGLNPMLAYMKGGAGTPSGATASGVAASSGGLHRMENVVGPAVSSGLSAALTMAQLENVDAQTSNVKAQTRSTLESIPNIYKTGSNIDADTGVKVNSAGKVLADTANVAAQTEKIGSEIDSIKQSIKESVSRILVNSADAGLKKALTVQSGSQNSVNLQQAYAIAVDRLLTSAKIGLTNAQAEYSRGLTGVLPHTVKLEEAKSIIEILRIAKERNLSEAEKTWFKEKISPFLPDVGRIVDTIK